MVMNTETSDMRYSDYKRTSLVANTSPFKIENGGSSLPNSKIHSEVKDNQFPDF